MICSLIRSKRVFVRSHRANLHDPLSAPSCALERVAGEPHFFKDLLRDLLPCAHGEELPGNVPDFLKDLPHAVQRHIGDLLTMRCCRTSMILSRTPS